MRVGIVSDTHDNVSAVERIVETFSEEDLDTLIHCGDYIAPPVIAYFEGFDLHGVLGNNDGETDGLADAFESIDGHLHGRVADLELDGTRVAILHGEDRGDVSAYAESGEYDYVLYGHHHERDHHETGETTVINPGAHFPTVPDDHRTVAVLDTNTDEVRFLDV